MCLISLSGIKIVEKGKIAPDYNRYNFEGLILRWVSLPYNRYNSEGWWESVYGLDIST
jgi:hypothetical protein